MSLIRYLVLFLVVLLLLCAAFLFQPVNIFDRSARKISIPQGTSTRAVQSLLEENNILRPHSGFALAARLLGLSKNIQAGEYALSPSESFLAVLLKLARGEAVVTERARAVITFPEGTSIYKMGVAMKEKGIENWEGFQKLTDDGITPDIRQRHWQLFKYIPAESLEGYLFPDTYEFYADASVEVMAEVMLKRFEEMAMPFWNNAKKDTKMSLHETLTLASIIEKEAKVPGERATISSVFYNRLRIGMALAADPTIKYALEKPSKKVYLDQLSVNSPYNTYKRRGLPPGPICNPGLESIKAAVYPAKTDYLYFVAKPDGSHSFSKSWDEHQRARIKVSTPTR